MIFYLIILCISKIICALIYSYITVHIFERDTVAKDNKFLMSIIFIICCIPILGEFIMIVGFINELENEKKNKQIKNREKQINS